MTMPSAALLDHLRDLTSRDKAARQLAADVITDVYSGFEETEVLIVSYVLVSLAAVETEEDCLEAQLNALGAITERHLLPAATLDRLATIDRDSLPKPLGEYYDALLSERVMARTPSMTLGWDDGLEQNHTPLTDVGEVRRRIAALDGGYRSIVTIGAEGEAHLGCGGDSRLGLVLYVTADNWVFHTLVNETAVSGADDV
jgi:hypothetical protein